MAYLFTNSKFENFQTFPLSHGIPRRYTYIVDHGDQAEHAQGI